MAYLIQRDILLCFCLKYDRSDRTLALEMDFRDSSVNLLQIEWGRESHVYLCQQKKKLEMEGKSLGFFWAWEELDPKRCTQLFCLTGNILLGGEGSLLPCSWKLLRNTWLLLLMRASSSLKQALNTLKCRNLVFPGLATVAILQHRRSLRKLREPLGPPKLSSWRKLRSWPRVRHDGELSPPAVFGHSKKLWFWKPACPSMLAGNQWQQEYLLISWRQWKELLSQMAVWPCSK